MDLLEQIKKSGVAVWHFPSQKFVPFIPCPGEQRVRLDVHDSLDNYAVYPAKYMDTSTMAAQHFELTSNKPLPYQIDLS